LAAGRTHGGPPHGPVAQKAKQRQKREQKRQAGRKPQNGGLAKAFADGEVVACYLNDDWREHSTGHRLEG
jgi:hypothetical protein